MPFQKNNQRGMSLIEVMVALVILGLVTIPLLRLFVTGNRLAIDARQRVEAVNYAQQLLEEVKGLPYDQVGRAQGGSSDTIILAKDTREESFGTPENPYFIIITAGTGVGQIRRITGYNSTTKTVSVYPDWEAGRHPDQTSSYVICRPGTLGIKYIKSATRDTVQLADDEPSIDDFYKGWYITVGGDNGPSQKRLITSYNGLSCTAIINRDWDFQPQNGWIYIVSRYDFQIEIPVKTNGSDLKTVTVMTFYSNGTNLQNLSLTTEKLRR